MDKVRGHKSRGESRSLTSTACCDGVQSFAVAGRGDGSLALSPWLAQEAQSEFLCLLLLSRTQKALECILGFEMSINAVKFIHVFCRSVSIPRSTDMLMQLFYPTCCSRIETCDANSV